MNISNPNGGNENQPTIEDCINGTLLEVVNKKYINKELISPENLSEHGRRYFREEIVTVSLGEILQLYPQLDCVSIFTKKINGGVIAPTKENISKIVDILLLLNNGCLEVSTHSSVDDSSFATTKVFTSTKKDQLVDLIRYTLGTKLDQDEIIVRPYGAQILTGSYGFVQPNIISDYNLIPSSSVDIAQALK